MNANISLYDYFSIQPPILLNDQVQGRSEMRAYKYETIRFLRATFFKAFLIRKVSNVHKVEKTALQISTYLLPSFNHTKLMVNYFSCIPPDIRAFHLFYVYTHGASTLDTVHTHNSTKSMGTETQMFHNCPASLCGLSTRGGFQTQAVWLLRLCI